MADTDTLVMLPPLTPTTLRDRYLRLMKAYAALGGMPDAALLAQITDFQYEVAALGTVLVGSEARTEAQDAINYWQTVRINAGERPEILLLARFDQDAALREAGNTPPYKGLAPFQTADSAFFFSRLNLVNKLTDEVKSRRLLALVGLSGAGKSSVVRAGLVPYLEGRAYDGVDDDGLTDSSAWHYPLPVLPGADPLAALQARFDCTIAVPADLVTALDAHDTAVLVSIDQFEEVFTLSSPGPRRDLFFDALVAAATTGSHRHMVVITMRSEYKGPVAAHPAFNDLFMACCLEVSAMQPSDLRKVIEEPAQRLGVGFEPGLVEELLTQVQGEPAGLPLLSFTLLKLWERRAGGPMKVADYKALGGSPRAILAKAADDVYDGLTLEQDRTLVQGIFTRLAMIGDSFEATSKRVKRADLAVLVAQDSAGGAIDCVLGKLADAGLIRTSPAGAMTPSTDIEVAHEALIRNWGRLTDWVKDQFAQQTTRKAFTLRAENWLDGKGDLISGVALDEARDFPDQTLVEADYIAASLRQARSRQRRSWAVTTALAVLVVLLVVALYLLMGQFRRNAANQRMIDAIPQVDALIARGDTLLAKKIMFAVLGDGEAPPPEMAAALQAGVLNEVDQTVLTAPGAGAVEGLSLGVGVMSLWADGKARVWRTPTEPPIVLEVPGREITATAMSPDGKLAAISSVPRDYASASNSPRLEIWTLPDTASDAPARIKSYKVDGMYADVGSIKYSPDGKTLIISKKRRDAPALIDTATGKVTGFVGSEAEATTAIFSPDGSKILITADDGTIAIYDAKTLVTIVGPIYVEKGIVTTARFSDSGARFVVGTDQGKLSVYSAFDGEKLLTLPGHSKAVTGVAFSPDSSMIISGSEDGTLRLWEHGITAGRLLRTIGTAEPGTAASPITAVAIADDGDTIVSARENGTISVLNLTGKKLVGTAPLGDEHLVPAQGDEVSIWAASAPRAQAIATYTSNATDKGGHRVSVWKVGQGQPSAEIKLGAIPADVQISDDGSRLAVLSQDASVTTISIIDTKSGALVTGKPIVFPTPLPGNDPPDVPIWTSLSADGSMMIMVFQASRLVAWRGGDRLVDIAVPSNHPLAVYIGGPLYVDLPIVFSVGGPMRFALSTHGHPIVAIHDGATGKLTATVKSSANVETFVFAPDGTAIFVGNDDGSGAIFDPQNGALRVRLDGQHSNAIGYAAFSDDGRTLVTTSVDGSARLWEARTGRLLHSLGNDGGIIANAAFSHDGRRLITGAENRVATLWDVATGKRLTVLPGPLKSGAITGWFSADDKSAITLSDDTTLRRWNIETPATSYRTLHDDACKDGGLTAQEARDAGLPDTARLACSARAGSAGRLSDEMIEKLRLRR